WPGRRSSAVPTERKPDRRSTCPPSTDRGPGGSRRRGTAGPLASATPPDGREIAFLSDAAQEGQLQIYVAPAAGGAARVLTRAHGQLEHPHWSPDGKRIPLPS